MITVIFQRSENEKNMSRKLFSFLSDSKSKQRTGTIKVVEETNEGSKFERRVSVSNSGRWKQKNKHRSVLNDDLFATPKNETNASEKQNTSNINTNTNINKYEERNKTVENRDPGKMNEPPKLETAF